ncbi:MAG: hypothetical protein KGH54_01785 [Candidatus Micrarchaeota archaeon]|nr:hypothetical protein [Candidatus Micrarchaeota archaeon]
MPFEIQLHILDLCKEPMLISEITRIANVSNSIAVRALESLGSFGMIESRSSNDVSRTFRLLGKSKHVFMQTEKGAEAMRRLEALKALFSENPKNLKLALDTLRALDNPSHQTNIALALRRDATAIKAALGHLALCGMVRPLERNGDSPPITHFVRTELGDIAAQRYGELLPLFVPTQEFDYHQLIQKVGKRN